MMSAFRTMLVAEDQQNLAASIANALSGDAGYFMTALSTTGQPPGEWYVSTGLVSELFADLIPLDQFTRGEMGAITGITRVYAGRPAEIQQMLLLAGMDIPVWAVEGIFEACRVLAEPPEVVLGYYGLRLVQDSEGLVP
jgi:hypothetical protein